MDTSGKYIRMCAKAHEVTDIYNFTIGEHYANIETGNTIMCLETDSCREYMEINDEVWYSNSDEQTWLPRQDQLWEMISDDSIQNLWDFYDYMCHGYALDDPDMMMHVKSIEEGLLMFIMKLKYNKKWDGKDWVKIDV